jgi:hypothetical protein
VLTQNTECSHLYHNGKCKFILSQNKYEDTVKYVLSPAFTGHLCYVATLFLSLCRTFPIETIGPKNLIQPLIFGPLGDRLRQT